GQFVGVRPDQFSELGSLGRDSVARTGYADRGDRLAEVVEHRGRDRVEPDLELAAALGVAEPAYLVELAGEHAGFGDGARGALLHRGARDRDRAGGVEGLPECGAVLRDVDVDPVRGAEQEGGVDLSHLDDGVVANDRKVDGLTGGGADRLEGRPG